MDEKLLDSLGNTVLRDDSDPALKDILMERIRGLQTRKLNIMLVGPTGVGKSSTINAIFNTEIATVGRGTDPQTEDTQKYEISNIVLWDTPGLGDAPEKDKVHAKKIANLLKAKDSDGDLLIDAVVVLIDGSGRDMRTAYETIENIIAPYIGDKNRIVIAINQCDMALKGRYWNYDLNCPDPQLIDFLEEKVSSVERRINESVGINVHPLYYSALHNYNISKLLLKIIESIPQEKRFMLADALNRDPNVWAKNDSVEDYNQEIQKEMKLSLTKALEGAKNGAIAGATVGSLIPVIGPVVGAAIGSVLGFLGGLIE